MRIVKSHPASDNKRVPTPKIKKKAHVCLCGHMMEEVKEWESGDGKEIGFTKVCHKCGRVKFDEPGLFDVRVVNIEGKIYVDLNFPEAKMYLGGLGDLNSISEMLIGFFEIKYVKQS